MMSDDNLFLISRILKWPKDSAESVRYEIKVISLTWMDAVVSKNGCHRDGNAWTLLGLAKTAIDGLSQITSVLR